METNRKWDEHEHGARSLFERQLELEVELEKAPRSMLKLNRANQIPANRRTD